jgi:hypothetical protein
MGLGGGGGGGGTLHHLERVARHIGRYLCDDFFLSSSHTSVMDS